MIGMLCHRMKAFPCNRDTPSAASKGLPEIISPFGDFPRHSTATWELISQTNYSICNIWMILQCFHCVYHPQSSVLPKQTNGAIKTPLAKLIKSFNLLWPRALFVVLLNLRSTPLGKPRLSPFEIMTGKPIMLDQRTYEPALLIGDVLIYYKTKQNM